MRRLRVSIAALLGGIALFGVAFTALIHPSPLWGNTFYSLTLGTLTIAVLAAIYGRGRRRAFWVGFSTCGWAYFLAIFGPEPISHAEPNLVTTAILEILYPYTIPRAVPGSAQAQAPAPLIASARRVAKTHGDGGTVILTGAFGGGGKAPVVPPTPWEIWTTSDRTMMFNQARPKVFRKIGHSMFCLLFALAGGFLTQRFHELRERQERAEAQISPG